MPIWAYKVLIVLILAGGILGGATWYYYSTQAEIAQLTTERDDYKNERDKALSDLETAEVQIEGLKDAAAFNEKAYQNLDNRAVRAENSLNRLIKLYQEHDLTKLATEKPGLIERRINEGTKDVLAELESLTTPK